MARDVALVKACTTRQSWIEQEMVLPMLRMMHVGDLPYVNMVKNLGTVTMNANGTYTVTYSIVVTNAGGAVSTYTLKDTPLFDDDITIISGNYSGQASGNMNITGSTTLQQGLALQVVLHTLIR